MIPKQIVPLIKRVCHEKGLDLLLVNIVYVHFYRQCGRVVEGILDFFWQRIHVLRAHSSRMAWGIIRGGAIASAGSTVVTSNSVRDFLINLMETRADADMFTGRS